MAHFLTTPRALAAFVCLFCFSAPSWAASFTDTHDDGSLSGWDVIGGRTWSETGGAMLPANGTSESGLLIHQGELAGNGDLEVDLTADQWNGQRGGVVFRYTSPTSFYFIGVKPGNQWEPHVYFCKDRLDNCTPLGKSDLTLGNTVTLKLALRGSQFTVFLNGDSATTISDDAHVDGRVGYAHGGEWNSLCSFNAIRWTEMAQGSSVALSSYVPTLSSSSALVVSSSSSVAASSSSQVAQLPVAVVTATVIGKEANWYAVALTLTNQGEVPLDAAELGWHMNWADHSAPLAPEIDWSSYNGATLRVEERDDFSATVWTKLPLTIAPGASATVNLRLHTQDFTPIDRNNDPSWMGMTPDGATPLGQVTVLWHGTPLIAQVPRNPFPTTAKQTAMVTTNITNSSANTLWLKCLVKNTGEVPLRKVRFSYYADTLASEQTMNALVDWASVPGTTVRSYALANGRKQFEVVLGEGMLPIGATWEVQLRLTSTGGGNLNFADDWSYADVANTAGNAHVAVSADGLLVSGAGPGRADSDGDGVFDDVEALYGTNPQDAQDAPLAGIPDRVAVLPNGEKQYVVYDFSRIPGFATRKNVAVPVEPGTLADNEVPRITWSGALSTMPVNPDRRFIALGGVFRIEAKPVTGTLVAAAIPFPDDQPTTLDAGSYNAYRFDTTNSQWQSGAQINGYDGAVHFSSAKFSQWIGGRLFAVHTISGAKDHLLAIDSLAPDQHIVLALGRNDKGQLGLGTADAVPYDYLRRVTGLDDVRIVAAGNNHSLAVTMDGRVFAWGDNSYGQLGLGSLVTGSNEPVQVVLPGGALARSVVAGYDHSFAITNDDRVFAWGRGTEGQLGLLESVNGADVLITHTVYTPTLLQALTPSVEPLKFQEVVAGEAHTLGMDLNGKLWTWGSNSNGQLLIPDGNCPEYDATNGNYGTEPCIYGSDMLPHSPAYRHAIGFHGLFADPYRNSVNQNIGAGRNSSVSWMQVVWGGFYGEWGDAIFPTPDPQEFGWAAGQGEIVNAFSLGSNHLAYLSQHHSDPLDIVFFGQNERGQLGSTDVSLTSHSIEVPNGIDVAAGDGWTALENEDPTVLTAAESRSYQIWGTMNGVVFNGAVLAKQVVNPVITLDAFPQTIYTPSLLVKGTVSDPLVKTTYTVKRLVILDNGLVKLDQTFTTSSSQFSETILLGGVGQDLNHVIEVRAFCDPGYALATAKATVHYIPVEKLAISNVSTSLGRLIYPNSNQSITFQLNHAASYTVEIWLKGVSTSIVKTISGTASAAGIQTVTWDGLNESNLEIARGICGITIQATDAYGQTATYSSDQDIYPSENALSGFSYSFESKQIAKVIYSPSSRVLAMIALVQIRDGALLTNAFDEVYDANSPGQMLTWSSILDKAARPAVIATKKAGTYFSVGWERPTFSMSRTEISFADLDQLEFRIDAAATELFTVNLLDADGGLLCTMEQTNNTSNAQLRFRCPAVIVPPKTGLGAVEVKRMYNNIVVDTFGAPIQIGGEP